MPTRLDTLRLDAQRLSAELTATQQRLSTARARAEQLRAVGLDDTAVRTELEHAAAEAKQRRAELAGVRGQLHEGLDRHVEGLAMTSVAPADVPVALLPVGLETRFRGDELWVRIIPDEVHVEDHELALTDAEVEAGRSFWRTVWRAGTAEPAATTAEREAWVRLAAALGSPLRAAWVADQTAPPAEARPPEPVAAGDALVPPPFPEPARRAPQGGLPPVARTLPDVFVVIAYRREGSGGSATWHEVKRATGRPVDDSVQLGLDPGKEPAAPADGEPAVPEGMRWLVNPEAAEAAGLLVKLPLPPGTQRIDRLIVLGVLGSMEGDASAARLAELLVGHRHSHGLGVLPVGTPTNNSGARRSGFGRTLDAAEAFDLARRGEPPGAGSDGALLCAALGIAPEALKGVAHASDREQAAAGHMNALLWPAAMGYWLDSLVQPGLPDAAIDDLRAHAVAWVRGRGPLPSLRIGRQPYGVLPTTSLSAWQPSGEPHGVRLLADLLKRTSSWWLDGVQRAPVVRAGADPGKGLLDVLAQAPVSRSVQVRSMVGANACYIPMPVLAGAEPAKRLGEEANRQRWMSLVALKSLGITGFPYIGQLVAEGDPVPELRLPYTVDTRKPPPEQQSAWEALSAYLRGLRGRATAELKAEDPHGHRSLLGLLARRSVLLERLRVGLKNAHGSVGGRMVEAHVRIDSAAVVSQTAMISTTATLRIGEVRSASSSVLASSVTEAGATGSIGMERYLDRELVERLVDRQRYAGYQQTLEAVEAVAALPPDRAELLVGEALDVASHRFDAWVTSLAARRLADLRTARPAGITLGAYGVVEDLVRRPDRQRAADPGDGNGPGLDDAAKPLWADNTGGGYVHAPSLNQAATAAVLRAGQMAHSARDPSAAALAVDLSSSRVRMAMELLDGVRQGQSLGALLGYRAERQLHELGAHTAVEVVRALAPPPSVNTEQSPEGLAPRSVCDGLALSRMPRNEVLAAVQQAGASTTAVSKVLDALIDMADSVADLLLAEGVHQIVQGNPERAAAALDTLNRGEGTIAEPAVVRTPRAGTTLTHRVMVALGRDVPPATGWPVDGLRAQAEPRLAAWAGHLLGNPGGVRVTLAAPTGSIDFGLAALGFGALDLVYENIVPRLLRHARLAGLAGASPQLDAPPVARLLAAAAQLRDLLMHARAGNGFDLVRPQDRARVTEGPVPSATEPGADDGIPTLPDVDQGERRARLDTARARLRSAIDALPELAPDAPAPPEADIAPALDILASLGLLPGGDPASSPGTEALIALRRAAAAALAASEAEPDDAQRLFGEGFAVLPLSTGPLPQALDAALQHDPVRAVPPAQLASLGGPAQALWSWLEMQGRVRAPVGRLADAWLSARLQGTAAPGSLRVLQWPREPFPQAEPAQRGQWIGTAFPAALSAEPVTAIVMLTLGEMRAADGMALLMVDEFTELVPAEETTTGLSFGFDAPGARPPQSVLLAVPPVVGTPWSIDALAQVVGETLDLARIRMVDLSAVAWAGRFLPTLYLTDGDVGTGLDLPMKSLVVKANQLWTTRIEP